MKATNHILYDIINHLKQPRLCEMTSGEKEVSLSDCEIE
jgi:hypothetical protein